MSVCVCVCVWVSISSSGKSMYSCQLLLWCINGNRCIIILYSRYFEFSLQSDDIIYLCAIKHISWLRVYRVHAICTLWKKRIIFFCLWNFYSMVRKIIISTQILYYIMYYCYYSLCEFIYKKEQHNNNNNNIPTNTETTTTYYTIVRLFPKSKLYIVQKLHFQIGICFIHLLRTYA